MTTPKRVWSQSLSQVKTRNLYPVTYSTNEASIRVTLAEIEQNLTIERRMLAAAILSRDTTIVRSVRRCIDRFESCARNCRERLYVLNQRRA